MITPDQLPAQVSAWAAAISASITTLVITLGLLLPKIASLKDDVTRLFTLHSNNAKAINDVSLAVPPTPTATPVIPSFKALIPILLIVFTLSGCVNGQYAGPTMNLSAGFNGVSVGIGLVGPAPGLVQVTGSTIAVTVPPTKL